MALVYRPDATTAALREKAEGRARNGIVTLRSFDEGVVTSMGCTIDKTKQQYYLTVSSVNGPPGAPIAPITGEIRVPVVFSIPEDVFVQYENPLIVVRREAITPNLSRWHPGQLQYRTPSYGAHKVIFGKNKSYEKTGYDSMEQVQQAVPYDISYTISILARHRGTSNGQRNNANRILDHIIRIYQPFTFVTVIDSIGDERTYEASTGSIANLDSVPEVSERIIGFSLSLNVMAELDLAPTEVYRTLVESPSVQEDTI